MKSGICLAAASAALLLVPARAGDCGKLVSYGTVSLTDIPGRSSAFVPVEIAGVPKLMEVDTGAGVTTITSAAANELNLKSTRTDVPVYDLTGANASQFVSASLKIGGLSGDKVHFMLGTAYLDNFGDPRVAGLLGADILQKFDVSIDFGAHTFALLSQDHCDGQVVYWPERPLAVIPFKLENGTDIILEVNLDGQDFKAQLDTGAGTSTLEKGKAQRSFDIVPGSADTPAAGSLGGDERIPTWKHTFKTLSLAGIEVANPTIYIIPDKFDENVNTWSTGSLLDRRANSVEIPPMLLGMDVLRHLHIYIAYREKKLYITPAAGEPPPGAAPAATPEQAK